VADPATNAAQVSWTPPANDGGSAISGYTVTPYIGSQAQTPVQVNDGSATSTTIKNLTNGTAYTFTVTATNNDGTSAASSPSCAITPDFTIFDFTTPSKPDTGETSSLELGVKFTADANGSIAGIRFYKSAANTGTHIGSLWTATGTLLASATFANETASGWQTVMFANPVSITAGTTYVAAYFDPNGHYAATTDGLSSSVDNAPLHAVADSTSPNGVYASTGESAFPSNSYQANNYWVDVVFSPSASSSVPGQPQGVSATPAWQAATVSWSAPWNGGSPITGYTVTPYIGSQAQSSTTVSGTETSATIGNLTNGTSYTFKVTATNANGTGGASAASSPVTPGPEPNGAWSPLLNWPLVAIHSTLLYTGNVLVWDGWQQPEPSQEWNPTSGTFSNAINSPDSIFCGAMNQLPDGRILVAGGYGELSTGNLGIVDTDIYDPATGTWTRVADMHSPRWYESMTELANGQDVVVSGKTTDFNSWADTPEVYDPTANTWTLLSNVNTSQIHELEYPSSYLLPNGNVFVLGPQEDKSFELNVPNQTWTQVGGSSGVVNGGSVMYQPGKILYAGGAASLSSPSTSNSNAAVIDTTSANPQWTPVPSMNYPRAFENLQMLADGTVLVVGGEPQTGVAGGQGEVSNGVLPSEIWDPSTQKFTTVASMAATRGYHTSTMLLPDGRVLVAGSGHASPGEPGQYSAQIYSPPYLFAGPRPTISSAPTSATYSSNITISTPDAAQVKSVNLVDLGTSTHQMDFSQHFVPLSFTAGSGSLSVQMPASGNYAPPGYYMLFIVSNSGVPSVASFINVSSSTVAPKLARASASAPAAPQGVTASAISAIAARVSWKVPADHGRPITSYTVTPYQGATRLKSKKVTGIPVPTSATVAGLRTGGRYTFTVAASNAAGTGPASRPSRSIVPSVRPRPAFIQKASAYADTSSHVTLKLASPVIARDRLIVETSVWGRGASTLSVTDSSGNVYTEVLSGVSADGTHTSVWTAPIRARAGTTPQITVNASEPADIGAVVAEYSGLSTAGGAAAIDQISAAGGVTRRSANVTSGATPATAQPGDLAVGIYADSGFGDTLKAGRGYDARIAIAQTRTMMEQLIEDRVVGSRARAAATVHTGAQTAWMMATIVFRPAGSGAHGRSTSRRLPGIRLPKPPAPGAGGGPVIPLSERPRPHPVAGAIAVFEGRLPNGQIVHYYCLVAPGGTVDDRRTLASVYSWMPANLKPLR
jgi:hypothetical protein